jgi:UDP-N-acetylmuramoylalanine--D-glutamate ligase
MARLDLSDLKDKNVLVAGAGLSGLAATRRLRQKGARVFLTDRQTADRLPALPEPDLPPAQLYLGREPDIACIRPHLLVLSPGVSPALPFIRAALAAGVPLLSEAELALADCPACLIGVTGSNGKTTTSTLCGALAARSGRKTVTAGNIGLPLCDVTEGLDAASYLVAELSSFQLETARLLHPHIAVLLNITPDHLDRHGTMQAYAAAKGRIFARQTAADLAVLNGADPLTRAFAAATAARVVFFAAAPLAEGYCLSDGHIVRRQGGREEKIIACAQLRLKGTHNMENVMAATAVADEIGVNRAALRETLRAFRPVPHRQEEVGVFGGVMFINDSKGTNPDSAIKALNSYDAPVVLIAGGRNKGLDLTEFARAAARKTKHLILIGEAGPELAALARQAGAASLEAAPDLEGAVAAAVRTAQAGDVVLLSPACTSWDMFKNYEERGETFKAFVRASYSGGDEGGAGEGNGGGGGF